MKSGKLIPLALLVVGVYVLWELFTGKSRLKNFRVVTRKDESSRYWMSVGMKIIVFFILLAFWYKMGFKI
jgi:hypothetical protein